jgi:hypothetical protein
MTCAIRAQPEKRLDERAQGAQTAICRWGLPLEVKKRTRSRPGEFLLTST